VNPVTDNPALTLRQKLLLSAIAGALVAVVGTLLWHYGGAHYVRKNTAALSRYPRGR
jgi:D-tyrosyl-tRNA(Tyr) deacylase